MIREEPSPESIIRSDYMHPILEGLLNGEVKIDKISSETFLVCKVTDTSNDFFVSIDGKISNTGINVT